MSTSNPMEHDVAVKARALDWFRKMCLIRTFEQEIHALNKAGLVCGTAHLYIGMEAIAVGACAAMLEDDYLTSTDALIVGGGLPSRPGDERGVDVGRLGPQRCRRCTSRGAGR